MWLSSLLMLALAAIGSATYSTDPPGDYFKTPAQFERIRCDYGGSHTDNTTIQAAVSRGGVGLDLWKDCSDTQVTHDRWGSSYNSETGKLVIAYVCVSLKENQLCTCQTDNCWKTQFEVKSQAIFEKCHGYGGVYWNPEWKKAIGYNVIDIKAGQLAQGWCQQWSNNHA